MSGILCLFMSLSFLQNIINSIDSLDSIAVQLIRFTNNKKGTAYFSREIEINPENDLIEYINGLREKYLDVLLSADCVDEYNGDLVKGRIYKLSVTDSLVKESYNKLNSAIIDPSCEGKAVLEGKWNALLIKVDILVDGEKKELKLFSIKSPITVLKNKYFWDKDQFKKFSSPLLTLNNNLDVVIINDNIYMFTMQAENLFNLERSYKSLCAAKVDEISNIGILSDVKAFKDVALIGQNPRRFVSFNQKRLDVLSDHKLRDKYMTMFNIPLNKEGLIDTKTNIASERLIKYLCNKGMLDPIDECPREVAGAKAWS